MGILTTSHWNEVAIGMKLQDIKQSAVISCDITLFIRLMEVAREEIKTDAALHRLIEKVSEAQAAKKKFLTMDDYKTIMKKD